MILSVAAEVKVYAPSYECESWKLWRKNRSDEQLKAEYQNFAYNRHRVLIPLREIRVSSECKTAA